MKKIKQLTKSRKLALVVLLVLITLYLKDGFWLALFGLLANALTDEIKQSLTIAFCLLATGLGGFYGLVTVGVLA